MSPLDPNAVHASPGALLVAGAWAQWLLAPILAIIVSVIYYRTAPTGISRTLRALAAAHGATIALLYMVAMVVFWTEMASPKFGVPFLLSLLVPIVLAIVSLFIFQGRKSIHWLQLVNLPCLAWTAFIGIMAITGDWL